MCWWGLQSATFKAARAFYTAQSYLAADKPAEAAALYERVQQRAREALRVWDDVERPDASALASLDALASQAKVSHADMGRHIHATCTRWYRGCSGMCALFLPCLGVGMRPHATCAAARVLAQAWRCVAHAECTAKRKRAEQEAQQGMDSLALDAKAPGRVLACR